MSFLMVLAMAEDGSRRKLQLEHVLLQDVLGCKEICSGPMWSAEGLHLDP